MQIQHFRIIASLTLVFVLMSIASAQSGGIFSITKSVVAGGGGQNVTAGIFALDYTLGQAVAGDVATGSPYEISPGFWDASPSGISGNVIYGNAISGPPGTRFVSNVLISAAGSPAVSDLTDFPGGAYSLTGFGAGAYTVTPSKTGGVNSITSFDAAKIAQHVAGTNILTGNARTVADVSGNGIVSSFDAAQIARYVTSSPPFGLAGTWKFVPVSRNYASVTGSIAGETFTALLMGEVSGNWTNTGARPATAGNK